jgi:ribosomal-protein-alanine N-acetyltransferase
MNAAAVRTRQMTLADLDRVVALARSLKDAPHWPLAAYLPALDAQAAPARVALVAEDEAGAIVGFAVALVVVSQAELETIVVAEQGQRRGVGRLLFTELAEKLKPEQVEEVFLEVRASNEPALGFYRSLGFSQTGRRPRYYADPVEDALLLALRLV